MTEGMNSWLRGALGWLRRRPVWLVVGGVLLAGAILAAVNHRVHLAQAAPYLLLLACPLLHRLLHRSHGGHGGKARGDETVSDPECHRTPAASQEGER